MSDIVHIELTKAEALLVFEALVKLDEQKVLDSAVCAEERSACWALEAILEKALPVFNPDYSALVEEAKRDLRGGAK